MALGVQCKKNLIQENQDKKRALLLRERSSPFVYKKKAAIATDQHIGRSPGMDHLIRLAFFNKLKNKEVQK